jgi:hypothetical protein
VAPRKNNGQFAKGNSGRPKGIVDRRTKYRQLIEEAGEEITEVAIALAKEGDIQMIKLCMDRMIPTVSPSIPAISAPFTLPKDPAKRAERITQAAAKGEIGLGEAERLMSLETSRQKAIEHGALVERVEKLEAQQ